MQDRDLKYRCNEQEFSFWQVVKLENLLMNVNWAASNVSKNKLKKNRGAGLEYMDVSL